MLATQEFALPKKAEDDDENKPEWTTEEIESLIDAIAQHQNDWDAISTSVGRSSDECVF
jgi:hypothetical protein